MYSTINLSWSFILRRRNTHIKGCGKHPCKVCGTIFSNRAYLERHMTKHTDKYACYECNKAFDCRSKLERHMKCHEDKNISCPFCGRKFRRNDNMERHKKLHLYDSLSIQPSILGLSNIEKVRNFCLHICSFLKHPTPRLIVL